MRDGTVYGCSLVFGSMLSPLPSATRMSSTGATTAPVPKLTVQRRGRANLFDTHRPVRTRPECSEAAALHMTILVYDISQVLQEFEADAKAFVNSAEHHASESGPTSCNNATSPITEPVHSPSTRPRSAC